MKNHRLAIRIWLTSAVMTAASLAVVSGASAMRNARDPFNQGYGSADPSAVSSSSSGFNWGIVASIAAAIIVAVVVAAAVAYVSRNRRTLAVAH